MMTDNPTTITAIPANRGRKIRRAAFRWSAIILALYVAWCVLLFLIQGWLIFPSGLTAAPLSKPLWSQTVPFSLKISDAESVEAWFVPAPTSTVERPAPVVVFFHGNGELIDFQEFIVDGYHRLGWSVLLPEYRGYGRSRGRPSEEAIVSDAERFVEMLVSRKEVDPSRIVYHGRSLGGGVASGLAERYAPSALILESTFTSMVAMGHRYFVPGFIVKHPFRTDENLASLDVPVLVFHGRWDGVIPAHHGRSLSEIAKNGRFVDFDCGHNDMPGRDGFDRYWNEIASLLKNAR